MKKIIVLEPNIANKIAAGEVVERPASVVKELIENSIDAGSTAVTVEIRNGGIDYIRITDNGSGIPSEDIATAFLRHATSKISSADDLDHIETLGFRGEALASIAAVSKVSVRTRTDSEDFGIHYMIEGGSEVLNEPCGCPSGTTFEVNELFFNVPARLKFLKSPRSEAALIGDYILRLILSNTSVSIKFMSNGKIIYHSPGDGRLENALYCVYGSELDANLYKVSYDDGYLRINGYVGHEAIAQSNRSKQSVFINQRYIKSPMVAYAVQRAFDTRLMSGKFPFFVLEMLVSNREIDVNVHPNKLSVRFKDEERIGFAVTRAVRDAFNPIVASTVSLDEAEQKRSIELSEADETVEIKLEPNAPDTEIKLSSEFNNKPDAESKAHYAWSETVGSKPASQSDIYKLFGKSSSFEAHDNEARPCNGSDAWSAVDEVESTIFPSAKAKGVLSFNDSGTSAIMPDLSIPPMNFNQHERTSTSNVSLIDESETRLVHDVPIINVPQPMDFKADDARAVDARIERPKQITLGIEPYTVLGVAFDTYIFVQQGDSIYCIDQHAAHERMLYEKLISDELRFDSQMLLMPELIRLDPTALALFQDNLPQFEELGFTIEPFGETTLCVRAVPNIIWGNSEGFINDALTIIGRNGKVNETDLVRSQLIQTACKRAVKAGDRLEDEEIERILSWYEGESVPLTCPHGRPVIIRISKQELKKRFKRIV
ncbi:MAG: DNA mismatch repair endonuclease MutL [Christensenellaceae bacterium]|nr:DNA mismatch repair endonuclease MutL [Christensenellaceae bacterium]